MYKYETVTPTFRTGSTNMQINRPLAAPNASLKLKKKKKLDNIGAFTPYNQRQHEVMFLSYLQYYQNGQNQKRKTKNCLRNRICRNKLSSETETKTSGIRINICIF